MVSKEKKEINYKVGIGINLSIHGKTWQATWMKLSNWVTNCETFHPDGFTARAGLDPLVLHEEGLDVQEVGLALQHAVSQDGPLTEVL